MTGSGSILEHKALSEFIGLLDDETSLGTRVRRVMREELTQRQQEMVSMYYMEEVSMREIAERTGVSVSSVSRTISRGRGRIRKYLKYNGRAMMNSYADY